MQSSWGGHRVGVLGTRKPAARPRAAREEVGEHRGRAPGPQAGAEQGGLMKEQEGDEAGSGVHQDGVGR